MFIHRPCNCILDNGAGDGLDKLSDAGATKLLDNPWSLKWGAIRGVRIRGLADLEVDVGRDGSPCGQWSCHAVCAGGCGGAMS